MTKPSLAKIEPVINNYSDEEIIEAKLQVGMRRIAKIRANLKMLQHEMSESILDGLKDCKSGLREAKDLLGELHATIDDENK